jgi:hypothetical protein
MAITPIIVLETARNIMAETSQISSSDNSAINQAMRLNGHLFAVYVVILIVTAVIVAIFTVWLRSSDSKLQELVRQDADARIADAGARAEIARAAGEQAKQEAEEARKAAAEATARAEEANERAAKADEETAKLKVRAAELEKEAATARLELARIDPINLPIKSIRVELYLLVRAQFIIKTAYAGGTSFDNFVIFDDKAALVQIDCSQGESVPVTTRDGNEPEPTSPNARSFKLSFIWPSTSFFETSAGDNPNLLFPIEKNKTSTVEFDKVVSKAQFVISGLEGPAKIEEGYCVITINGSIQRRFSVSKDVDLFSEQLGKVTLLPKHSP